MERAGKLSGLDHCLTAVAVSPIVAGLLGSKMMGVATPEVLAMDTQMALGLSGMMRNCQEAARIRMRA